MFPCRQSPPAKSASFASSSVSLVQVQRRDVRQAGQFAAVRLAHLEAIRHFDRGLALAVAEGIVSLRDGLET